MPNRILRESILDSEAVNTLTPDGEVFYRRLMSVVDDFGRFDARPSVLRSRLYPLRVERMSEAEISARLDECATAGLLTRYHVDGKPYLVFHKLGGLQRATRSKFPHPPTVEDDCAQARASDITRAQPSACTESGSEAESDTGSEAGKDGPAATPPDPPAPFDSGIVLVFPTIGRGPKEWRLTQDQFDELQADYPTLDVLSECRQARQWLKANGAKTAGGMDKFLINWLNRSVANGRGRRPKPTDRGSRLDELLPDDTAGVSK